MLTIDLTQLPEFIALQHLCYSLKQEVAEVREQLPAYVPVEVAMSLTGLSATTLWRERKRPGTLIKSKQDHGLRYERASLLAYNKSRTEVKPRGRRQS